MLLLATFLSWGWPKEKTAYGPPLNHVPMEWVSRPTNPCCGSMRPALKPGDVRYWEPYTGQTPLEGFIVDTGAFSHRVTAETKDAVLTAGDANRNSDGWTPKKQIKWILRYIVRK